MNISHRIQLAIDAESKTTFVIPFGDAFLKVYAWLTEDRDYDGDNIIQVDLFADKACTRLIAEQIEWENIEDQDSIFLAIRTRQFEREDRLRGLQRLASDIRTDAQIARIVEGVYP